MSTINLTQISNGDALDATTVDNNFDTIAAAINGNLDATNLAANAVTEAKLGTGAVTTTKVADAAVTATKLDTGAITLGYSQMISDFSHTNNNIVTDVTGLSVTVTVPSGGRRLKITSWGSRMISSGTSPNHEFYIREGSTILARSIITTTGTNFGVAAHTIASFVASAGSHTYKVSHLASAAGTHTITASSDSPSFILVELI